MSSINSRPTISYADGYQHVDDIRQMTFHLKDIIDQKELSALWWW